MDLVYKKSTSTRALIMSTNYLTKTRQGGGHKAGGPGASIIKLITAVINGFRNKLECMSLASLSSLV